MTVRLAIASRLAATLLLAAAGACTDRSPTGATPTDPAAEARLAALECAVDVRAGTMSCAPAPGTGAAPDSSASRAAGDLAPRLDLTVGGQHTYITISTAGPQTRDDATELVTGPVIVSNLMAQPLGTPDGNTVTGVRVFFHQRPVVTQGTGTVEVANPDGVGTFTGSNQPYHLYNQIIRPGTASTPETWQFRVPATVVEFRFQVYVRAAMPAEQGVLRWTQLAGGGLDVWGSGPNNVFVVGGGILLSRFDGTSWQTFRAEAPPTSPGAQPRRGFLSGVFGTGPNDVYVAGFNQGNNLAQGPSVWRFDGSALSIVFDRAGSIATQFNAAGSNGSGGVRVAGDRYSADQCGSDWCERDYFATGRVFFDVDNNSPIMVGLGRETPLSPSCALIVGGSTNPSCPPGAFRGVWTAASGNSWVVGDGGMIYHNSTSQPTVFSPVTSPVTTTLYGVWGSAPNDIYAVGAGGVLLHYNGSAWTQLSSGVSANLRAIWGSGPSDIYVVGEGVVLHGTR